MPEKKSEDAKSIFSEISVSEKTLKLGPAPDGMENTGISFQDLKKGIEVKNRNDLSRFSSLKMLGTGGTGNVMNGFEMTLGREVAVKILRPKLREKPKAVERFIREARATAQIEHPNIVPVHEIGILEDTGVFFTMKKVNGETLSAILGKLKDGNREYKARYPRQRLLEIFVSACQGIAFAHSKGIIHRDLKPENIMIGDFGEVLVMDWGLVKHVSDPVTNETGEYHEPLCHTDLRLTVEGSISGTPLYMSPEQAAGKNSEVDWKSDLFSLGATLYTILTYSRSPFDGNKTVKDVLNSVINADFPPPRKCAPGLKIPRELEAICLKAMAKEKNDRYENVQALISDIRNYMQGFSVSACREPSMKKFWKLCLRHPVISSVCAAVLIVSIAISATSWLTMYMKYRAITDAAHSYMTKGTQEFRKAEKIFREYQKLNSQRRTKEKGREELLLEKQLHKANVFIENNYNTALMLYSSVPGIYENDRAILDAYREIMSNRIEYSILTGNYEDTSKWIELLRLWFGSNFEDLGNTDEQKRLFRLIETIKGNATIRITCSPPGADMALFSIAEAGDGTMKPEELKQIGTSSSFEYGLAKGSYLLRLKTDRGFDVNYPFTVKHNEKLNINVEIPPAVPDGMIYIPAGKFYMGGEEARFMRLQQLDLDAFFIKKNEVTFREYLEFWNSLGDPALKKKFMGKIQLNTEEMVYLDAWDGKGILIPELRLDRPVVGISHKAAAAYCQWLSAKIRAPVKLPSAEQWEKAARGADGRNYVWGNGYKRTYSFTLENTEARKKYGNWAPPGSFPADTSIYGVSDMGGNVREYTSSRFPDETHFHQIKGASASTGKRFLYCAYSSDTPVIPTDVGFRYIIPLHDEGGDVK